MEVTSVSLSGINLTYVAVVGVIALIALVMAVIFRREVLAANDGTPKMQSIARGVQEGASAYLGRQFRTLSVFAVAAFFLLLLVPVHASADFSSLTLRICRSVAFLAGAVFSALIGFLGMWLAVRANVRVAAAARSEGRDPAMKIAFRTGAHVGMATVGLGLLGASLVVFIFRGDAPTILEGFGFGAAMLAMFMRVGGGIFTKAADVGADLVGKVEKNIPEDDPRNAATIADNVGDNVGDCAGMAADLFESYAVMLVASLILGKAAFGESGLVFPLIVPAIGVITAIIGVFLTRPRTGENGLRTINRSFYMSAAISAVLVAIAAFAYLPSSFAALNLPPDVEHGLIDDPRIVAIGAVVIGIVLAVLILSSPATTPAPKIAQSTMSARPRLPGPQLSCWPAFRSVSSRRSTPPSLSPRPSTAHSCLAGRAWSGCSPSPSPVVGCLPTVGVIVAMDTFGPVSDNAQGIAEMSGDVHGAGAQALTELDAVGNTTKAITKGIAIATAVLAATALFGSYTDAVRNVLVENFGKFVDQAVVYAPQTLVGVILGAAVVFLFSGLAISAVGRAAGAVVFEVRRQFHEIPGIMEGTAKPEYGRVVDICTKDSLRELATPGLLAICAPIAVGFGLGAPSLAGYLGGAIAAGTLMAVFLANSGGAWDNAKKLVEDGHHGGKGSEAHAATVIGDTVGDPFKDTAGPAINPLIKVMNLVSLLIAPAVVAMSPLSTTPTALRYVIAGIALAVIITMVTISTRRGVAMASSPSEPVEPKEEPKELESEDTVQVPIKQNETKVDKLAK
jgi:K(+)-stimulated pyrophosphate-energized sodium pump